MLICMNFTAKFGEKRSFAKLGLLRALSKHLRQTKLATAKTHLRRNPAVAKSSPPFSIKLSNTALIKKTLKKKSKCSFEIHLFVSRHRIPFPQLSGGSVVVMLYAATFMDCCSSTPAIYPLATKRKPEAWIELSRMGRSTVPLLRSAPNGIHSEGLFADDPAERVLYCA